MEVPDTDHFKKAGSRNFFTKVNLIHCKHSEGPASQSFEKTLSENNCWFCDKLSKQLFNLFFSRLHNERYPLSMERRTQFGAGKLVCFNKGEIFSIED